MCLSLHFDVPDAAKCLGLRARPSATSMHRYMQAGDLYCVITPFPFSQRDSWPRHFCLSFCLSQQMLRQLLTSSWAAIQAWAKGTSAQRLEGMLERRLLWPRDQLVSRQVIPCTWSLYEMQTVFLWVADSSLLLLARCSSKDGSSAICQPLAVTLPGKPWTPHASTPA